jgi:hypothetical protein
VKSPGLGHTASPNPHVHVLYIPCHLDRAPIDYSDPFCCPGEMSLDQGLHGRKFRAEGDRAGVLHYGASFVLILAEATLWMTPIHSVVQ